MERQAHRRKILGLSSDIVKLWVPIFIIVALGFFVAFLSLEPAPPKEIRLATGGRDGSYFAYGERYREILKHESYGYDLELVATAGSVENLDLLRRGEVDLAMVQGGTLSASDLSPSAAEVEEGRSLRALASLYFEPLWVFHRADREIERLFELEGWRIAIGPQGSGTRALALQLLDRNEIDSSDGELLALGSRRAAAALEAGEIDAAFFVTAPSTPFIKELLQAENVELMSFKRHRAYTIQLPYVSRVLLGEGSVDIAENLPREDISLLAVSASLVAREDLHRDLIPPVLEMLRVVHGSGGVFEARDQFPSAHHNELPLLPEAERYLAHGPPFLYRIPGISFRVAALIDRLKILLLPLLTLLIPLTKIAPPLYRWRIRSSIYRWYEGLKEIDEILRDPRQAEDLSAQIQALRQLEQEVTEVQVPLSYMDEFYRLRGHIDLIRGKLEKLQAAQRVEG